MCMYIPWTEQELLEYTWTRKPDSLTQSRTGADSWPRGVEWWILDAQDYRSQGGRLEPSVQGYVINHWWLSRIDPGMTFPMHTDLEHDHDTRLWIPLSDYEPGHVFIVHGKLVDNYSRGDCVKFQGNDLHGAANLSRTVKISLQCTVTSQEE